MNISRQLQRLALTLTAAVLWVFANFYPVMSISMKGLKNSATLWDSVLAMGTLGVVVFALGMGRFGRQFG